MACTNIARAPHPPDTLCALVICGNGPTDCRRDYADAFINQPEVAASQLPAQLLIVSLSSS
jgi:hypothetical protein